jgi:formylglycine-generating enzyme required for sulfatase activity
MTRPLQRPLVCVGGVVLFALATLLLRQSAVPAQPATKLATVLDKKHKNYTETLNKYVSIEMIAIPGGTYMMGTPATEKERGDDEGPQHPVTIKPFWMAKFETTWDVYDLYWMKKDAGGKPASSGNPAADAVTKPTPPYADETFGHGREGHPALCMTIHAAMEFCRWLSAKTGKNYRLPTEAEWEWACRAGTTTAFSYGDDPEKMNDYGWYADNADDKTHKVGTKKANPWGLHDMHGNVAEWCLDLYQKDFYSKFPLDKPTIEPFNPPTNKRYPYVARGGSWTQAAEKCRSGARNMSDKEWLRRDPQRPQSIWWMTDADFVGFRVVCPVEEVEGLKGLKSKITRESDDY